VTEKGETIIQLLEEAYPDVNGTSLEYRTPLEMLISTILSAQSTDDQINKITMKLFKKYRSLEDYIKVSREELEQDIYSSGFYKRKAKHIQETASIIHNEYGGKVPDTMEDLLKLKGVARKTANIVLGNAYGKIVGIAVDTHVWRLANRLGLSAKKNRDKIEQDLMEIFPQERWLDVNFLLITHGRRTCSAKKANCESCVLREICPSAFSFPYNMKN
jgi:endonuclease-3